MNPDNPVVRLCAAGMAAEGEGRSAGARTLFEEAWNASRDDYEACIAAHYLARHQATPEATFEWNARALERADAVADDRTLGFYPSLYLNYAHSLEQVGRTGEACRYYTLAAAKLEVLPPSPYADLVRMGVTAGQTRTCPVGEA
jgi:hypothetical protein